MSVHHTIVGASSHANDGAEHVINGEPSSSSVTKPPKYFFVVCASPQWHLRLIVMMHYNSMDVVMADVKYKFPALLQAACCAVPHSACTYLARQILAENDQPADVHASATRQHRHHPCWHLSPAQTDAPAFRPASHWQRVLQHMSFRDFWLLAT